MTAQDHVIETDEFLRSLTAETEFIAETRSGMKVKLFLTPPSFEDIETATSTVKTFSDGPESYATASYLIRFACQACIKGIDRDNVIPFLGQLPAMPPVPPVVRKCLEFFGVPQETIEAIGNSLYKKS